MDGLILDGARFYKPSAAEEPLQIDDEGVEIILETTPSGFELRVVRGKVILSADHRYTYPYATREKASQAFEHLCEALQSEGFRRSQAPTK
jgi:hypothetical protein